MPEPTAPEPAAEPATAQPATPALATPDSDATGGSPARTRAERAGRIHRLDDAQVDALEAVFRALAGPPDAGSPDAPPTAAAPTADAGEVLRALGDSTVAEGFLSEALTADPASLDALAAFADVLLAEADRQHALDRHDRHDGGVARRAAPLWLQARVLDRRGDVLAVEPLLADALAADPDFVPALELRARYASDRGDARTAVALLRRAGVSDDDEYLVELERMIPRPRHDIGRNDPCWCGSGRKYKQCHLNRTQLDLDERAFWLYRKAAEHIGDGPARSRMLDLATALRGEDELTAEAAWMALTDPIVADLVLVHDGAGREFLTHRGPLLPDDERQLAAQWAEVPQSVFVVTVAPEEDAQLRVRDERTGAVHTVGGFAGQGASFPTGQRLLGRVVSTAVDGDPAKETLMGGLLFLDDALADDLVLALDDGADALALAQIVGAHRRRTAAAASPPQDPSGGDQALVTSEGEPLVFCTTTYAVPTGTVDDVVAALDGSEVLTRHDEPPDAGAPDDDAGVLPHLPGAFGRPRPSDTAVARDAHRWREEVEAQGSTWIRGTVTLAGDELVLHTNAEARHDRLVALLAALAPQLQPTDEERRPAADFPT